MTVYTRRFPLVADDVPVIIPSKMMAIYENEDLITNIHGNYQEKDYSDVTRNISRFDGRSDMSSDRAKTVSEGKSYAEMAREEARRDIKKKRQAYLVNEGKTPSKMAIQRQLQANLPKSPSKTNSEFSHLADRIRQEDYILAELPVTYTEPRNPSVQEHKRNSFDFLKRSQIYNKEEQQSQKEHRIAQELNLTRFEDAN